MIYWFCMRTQATDSKSAAALRRLQASDIPVSAQIIRVAFAAIALDYGITQGDYPAHSAFLEEEALMDELRGGAWMIGLFEGGLQAGFLSLRPHGEGAFYLERLAVLPQCRHKGYGEKLLDCATAMVAAAGGGSILLGALHENERLVRWYARYGFREAAAHEYASIPRAVSMMVLAVAGK